MSTNTNYIIAHSKKQIDEEIFLTQIKSELHYYCEFICNGKIDNYQVAAFEVGFFDGGHCICYHLCFNGYGKKLLSIESYEFDVIYAYFKQLCGVEE